MRDSRRGSLTDTAGLFLVPNFVPGFEMRTDDDEAPPAYHGPVDWDAVNPRDLSVVRDTDGDQHLYLIRPGGVMQSVPRAVAAALRDRLANINPGTFAIGTVVTPHRPPSRTPRRQRGPIHTLPMANPPAEATPVETPAPASEPVTFAGAVAAALQQSAANREAAIEREVSRQLWRPGDTPLPERTPIPVPRSGTPPPPPHGSTGLDTSHGADTERVARERREVQRAMAEAAEMGRRNGEREREANPQTSLMSMLMLGRGPLRARTPPPAAHATPLRDQSPPGAPRADRSRLPASSIWARTGQPRTQTLPIEWTEHVIQGRNDGPRERPYTPGDRQRMQEQLRDRSLPDEQETQEEADENQERTYSVLVAVHREPAQAPSSAPSDNGRQKLLDVRRHRLKGPVKTLMSVVDEVQDEIPSGCYLRMANAAKSAYEVIEELDPTTAEGYRVRESDVRYETAEERIAELEERNRQLQCDCDEYDVGLSSANRELHRLNTEMTAVMRNEKAAINQWEAYKGVVSALESHHVIGPHVAFSKVMASVGNGADLMKRQDSSLPRKWKTLRSGVWNRRSFVIETINYPKNDYTEGFGAMCITLDEATAKAWEEFWAPDVE